MATRLFGMVRSERKAVVAEKVAIAIATETDVAAVARAVDTVASANEIANLVMVGILEHQAGVKADLLGGCLDNNLVHLEDHQPHHQRLRA